MRIALGKLLLEKPNLLLLDEPTNHLDLEARNWLENYLVNYPYAYVMISHDRYFLDTTVKRIIELWNKGMHFYSGNYEKYLQQKTERREQLVSAYKNQRERIEADWRRSLTASARRRRRPTGTEPDQRTRKDRANRNPERGEEIHYHSAAQALGPQRGGVKGVSKSYGAKHVFSGVDFVIERGERIALVATMARANRRLSTFGRH